MDVVTVVFAPELPYLEIQARSLGLYATELGINQVFVVVNDHDSVCDQIDPDWWGSLSHRVNIIPRSTWQSDGHCDGWVTQQALKILAAAMSTQSWTMILDAKTFLVQHIDVRHLTDSQGRMQVGTDIIAPIFAQSQRLVNEIFGTDMTQVPGPGGVPHFLHTPSVQNMLEFLQAHTHDTFLNWFQSQGMITEFVLCAGWIHREHGGLHELYQGPAHYQAFNICHSQAQQFQQLFASIGHARNMSVGLHRRVWPVLSIAQQRQYVIFLAQRNLVMDVETTMAKIQQALT